MNMSIAAHVHYADIRIYAIQPLAALEVSKRAVQILA